MNLVGKYIEINLKNYEQVINFLYRKGCIYGGPHDNINSAKYYIHLFIESSDNLYYIKIISDNFFASIYRVDKSRNIIDGNILIREYKLKRILK